MKKKINSRFNRLFFAAILVLIVYFTLGNSLFADNTGTVTGKVVNKKTCIGIKGVIVKTLPTNGSAITDDEGSFIINEVPPGKYEIAFTPPEPNAFSKYMNYGKITIHSEKNINIDKLIKRKKLHEEVK